MTPEEHRARIDALIADMTAITRALRENGIEPGQKEDREAIETVKHIAFKAYGG